MSAKPRLFSVGFPKKWLQRMSPSKGRKRKWLQKTSGSGEGEGMSNDLNDMIDLVARYGYGAAEVIATLRAANEALIQERDTWAPEMADALAKLRAENERLTEDLRVAVISDTAYCKALEVEGAKLAYEKERLRAALTHIPSVVSDMPDAYHRVQSRVAQELAALPARPESDASGLATQMEG